MMFIAALVFSVVLIATISFIMIKLWFLFVSLSIVFSRLTFSFLAAVIMRNNHIILFPSNNILNLVSLAAIVFGCLYLFSLLPRVNTAILSFCTLVIAGFSVIFTRVIICSIFKSLPLESLVGNIIGLIIVVIIVVVAWFINIGKSDGALITSKVFSKSIFVIIGRCIASIVYAFGIGILILFFFPNCNLTESLSGYMILLGLSAGAYVVDLFLFDKTA